MAHTERKETRGKKKKQSGSMLAARVPKWRRTTVEAFDVRDVLPVAGEEHARALAALAVHESAMTWAIRHGYRRDARNWASVAAAMLECVPPSWPARDALAAAFEQVIQGHLQTSPTDLGHTPEALRRVCCGPFLLQHAAFAALAATGPPWLRALADILDGSASAARVDAA